MRERRGSAMFGSHIVQIMPCQAAGMESMMKSVVRAAWMGVLCLGALGCVPEPGYDGSAYQPTPYAAPGGYVSPGVGYGAPVYGYAPGPVVVPGAVVGVELGRDRYYRDDFSRRRYEQERFDRERRALDRARYGRQLERDRYDRERYSREVDRQRFDRERYDRSQRDGFQRGAFGQPDPFGGARPQSQGPFSGARSAPTSPAPFAVPRGIGPRGLVPDDRPPRQELN